MTTATRHTMKDQLAAARANQLGEIEIRLRAPDGTVRNLACFGKVTSAMAAEAIKAIEKITEGNR